VRNDGIDDPRSYLEENKEQPKIPANPVFLMIEPGLPILSDHFSEL
jgi:hypothetical protein